MKTRLYLIILMMLLTALTVRGQKSTARQAYYQAESDYDIGRIEQALTILQDNIKGFSGNIQQSAYRLMALCWLGLDDNEKAEEWTRSLLSQDPYYTASSQDPQRFIDLVESIKLGLTAKITTDGEFVSLKKVISQNALFSGVKYTIVKVSSATGSLTTTVEYSNFKD